MFDTPAIRQDFTLAAAQYDAHAHLQAQVREQCLALARQFFPARGRILDLGSGTGALAAEAANTRPHWQIVDLDIALGMCQIARKRAALAINADAASLPLADDSCDGIFSSLMLQWTNAANVFREIARVLTPGSYAVLATLASGTLSELQHAFATLDASPHVSQFLEPHRILADAHQAGLTLSLARQPVLMEYYSDTIAIMRALQAIGATNKQAARKRGLMTPRQFARLEQCYARQFATPRGLPVSWHVLYLVLQKA